MRACPAERADVPAAARPSNARFLASSLLMPYGLAEALQPLLGILHGPLELPALGLPAVQIFVEPDILLAEPGAVRLEKLESLRVDRHLAPARPSGLLLLFLEWGRCCDPSARRHDIMGTREGREEPSLLNH